MAINVYSGLMGSGKTYEIIRSVLVPAISSGRRVVSNISGLNAEKIHEYCLEHHKNIKPKEFGEIVLVTDERITEDGFFPIDGKPEIASVVQHGDLVVIDEAWRFWSTGQKISDEHQQFFRMHRHFTHPETNVSCDLSFIFQSVSDIHRQLKAVVEIHFRTTKLKSLGLTKQYRVQVYEGAKQTKSALSSTYLQSYDKNIFPLYQSYAAGVGKEVMQDKRQNIFRQKSFWIFLSLAILAFTWGFYTVFSLFNGGSNKTATQTSSINESALEKHPKENKNYKRQVRLPLSKEYRVAGTVAMGDFEYVLVVQDDFRGRFLPASEFVGLSKNGVIDDEIVSTYSGQIFNQSKGFLP